jgi:hypothetical protein
MIRSRFRGWEVRNLLSANHPKPTVVGDRHFPLHFPTPKLESGLFAHANNGGKAVEAVG